jgi:hypothetical protein
LEQLAACKKATSVICRGAVLSLPIRLSCSRSSS